MVADVKVEDLGRSAFLDSLAETGVEVEMLGDLYCAVVNDDWSGLDDDDQRNFEFFMQNMYMTLGTTEVNVFLPDDFEHDEFGLCEVTGVRGHTIKLIFYNGGVH